MTVLIVLVVAIALVSGLTARMVVLGARHQPLRHSLVIGAAVTVAAGFGCWFVVTPLDGVLRTPAVVPALLVLTLATIAVWRSRRPATG